MLRNRNQPSVDSISHYIMRRDEMNNVSAFLIGFFGIWIPLLIIVVFILWNGRRLREKKLRKWLEERHEYDTYEFYNSSNRTDRSDRFDRQ